MAHISATILTYNEEKHIADCIHSLQGIADEIIVVDSFSTDSTPEICKRLGCEVTQRAMAGYGAQRQYATTLTSHHYVLAIDADEVLSPSLRASLMKLKNEGFTHRGYSFSRLNFYCGVPIRHCGWYPDIQVRLFDKRYANWDLRDVDERVIFHDNIVPHHIDGDILHYRCDTPEEYTTTQSKHAALMAKLILAKGSEIKPLEPFLEGAKSFIKCFIGEKGIMDGTEGREISLRRYHLTLAAWKAARAKQLNDKQKQTQQNSAK